MQCVIVEEKMWDGEWRFLHVLDDCTLLPGPEARQFASYRGSMFHAKLSGIVTGGLFSLPGFVSLLVLSVQYSLGG